MKNRALKKEVAKILNVSIESINHIEKIGGMTNDNYLIEINDFKYILKIFGKGTDKLINREIEKKNLEIIKMLDLDVENLAFDIKTGIKVNKYIENAKTFSSVDVKKHKKEIAGILATVHNSKLEFVNEFNVFKEMEKYEELIHRKIQYSNYDNVRNIVDKLEKTLVDLGSEYKKCHIDLVPENFIMDTKKIYLIDWEYSAMNDPMWDLASLFLESEFEKEEEEQFLDFYGVSNKENSKQKIAIFKIMQDLVWSLWTQYKEEQGEKFGDYGTTRYNRALKNIEEYLNLYEK